MFTSAKTMEYILNPHFVRKQRISKTDQLELYRLHAQMDQVLVEAEVLAARNQAGEYQKIWDKVQGIEYAMQHRWKFDLDKKLHTHWQRLPEPILLYILAKNI